MLNTVEAGTEILLFMKERYHLVHRSNCFFRDLHYGLMEYSAKHGSPLGYTKAEKAAHELARSLEQKGILKKIDSQTWLLNYPEFKIVPAAAAQPQ
jgi:hypothetical protein